MSHCKLRAPYIVNLELKGKRGRKNSRLRAQHGRPDLRPATIGSNAQAPSLCTLSFLWLLPPSRRPFDERLAPRPVDPCDLAREVDGDVGVRLGSGQERRGEDGSRDGVDGRGMERVIELRRGPEETRKRKGAKAVISDGVSNGEEASSRARLRGRAHC